MVAEGGQGAIGSWVIEATEFNFEVILRSFGGCYDLKGHQYGFKGNMHIDSRVAEDADFKYEIQFNSRGN